MCVFCLSPRYNVLPVIDSDRLVAVQVYFSIKTIYYPLITVCKQISISILSRTFDSNSEEDGTVFISYAKMFLLHALNLVALPFKMYIISTIAVGAYSCSCSAQLPS
jgi:hypothetical protein